ncbi:hypothetical protein SANTM175S_09747 [Streptomyces antimycoticus]
MQHGLAEPRGVATEACGELAFRSATVLVTTALLSGSVIFSPLGARKTTRAVAPSALPPGNRCSSRSNAFWASVPGMEKLSLAGCEAVAAPTPATASSATHIRATKPRRRKANRLLSRNGTPVADTPGVRVRLPVMLGSTGRVAYLTDAEGEDAIEIAQLPRASGPGEPRRLAAGLLGRVQSWSPRRTATLAVAAGDGRLLLVDTSTDGDGEVTELIRSDNGPVGDLAFSPTRHGSPGPIPG